MTSALVGHTGFVGSNLLRQHRFDALFNSQNVEQIAGRGFALLVVCGMPAARWVANADPAGDRATLERLWAAVRQARRPPRLPEQPRRSDVLPARPGRPDHGQLTPRFAKVLSHK